MRMRGRRRRREGREAKAARMSPLEAHPHAHAPTHAPHARGEAHACARARGGARASVHTHLQRLEADAACDLAALLHPADYGLPRHVRVRRQRGDGGRGGDRRQLARGALRGGAQPLQQPHDVVQHVDPAAAAPVTAAAVVVLVVVARQRRRRRAAVQRRAQRHAHGRAAHCALNRTREQQFRRRAMGGPGALAVHGGFGRARSAEQTAEQRAAQAADHRDALHRARSAQPRRKHAPARPDWRKHELRSAERQLLRPLLRPAQSLARDGSG